MIKCFELHKKECQGYNKFTATLPHHQLVSYQCTPWRHKSKGYKLNQKITHLELQNALDSVYMSAQIKHHKLAFPAVRVALAKDLHPCGRSSGSLWRCSRGRSSRGWRRDLAMPLGP